MAEIDVGLLGARQTLAHHFAASPLPELIPMLTDILTSSRVAYISGVSETRALQEWQRENRQPRDMQCIRLRGLAQVVGTLYDPDHSYLPTAWLETFNPDLDYQMPMDVIAGLRNREESSQKLPAVLTSAWDKVVRHAVWDALGVTPAVTKDKVIWRF